MRVALPFVGRTRELRCLDEWLMAGQNVVLAGRFGSGRTTLVHRFAYMSSAHWRCVFASSARSRADVRRTVIAMSQSALRPVVVLDDIAHVTTRLLAWARTFTWPDVRVIAIVDRSIVDGQLVRLRSALGAAPVMTLTGVSIADAVRYFTDGSTAWGMTWPKEDIRGLARATHDSPLGMRLALEAAARRARSTRRPLPR